MIIKMTLLALLATAPVYASTSYLSDAGRVSSSNYYTDDKGALALAPSDDGSSSKIDLGFNFTLYGTTYTSLYVNNNGNVTFNNPLMTYTPQGLSGVDKAIISPYFADVDTRGAGNVFYRETSNAIYITWDNVGYYDKATDKLNSFQLVLRADGTVVAANEGQIGFFYKDLPWTTGSASEGHDGLGGITAAVGFGDGAGNVQALTSSQQPNVNQVLADSHMWFNTDHGGDVVLAAPVPEPETYALMGLGLITLLATRKRK